jgi:hypothetical protein
MSRVGESSVEVCEMNNVEWEQLDADVYVLRMINDDGNRVEIGRVKRCEAGFFYTRGDSLGGAISIVSAHAYTSQSDAKAACVGGWIGECDRFKSLLTKSLR